MASRVSRTARVARKTRETDITVELDLDGSGKADVETPLPFLSHMVEQIARHGLIDFTVVPCGDVDIDGHHTTEDLGIVLGQAVLAGARRQGRHRPLRLGHSPDGRSAGRPRRIDFSGRPFFVWKVPLPKAKFGTWDVELAPIFFEAFARAAMCNLHVRLHEGENLHHIIEILVQGVREGARPGDPTRPCASRGPLHQGFALGDTHARRHSAWNFGRLSICSAGRRSVFIKVTTTRSPFTTTTPAHSRPLGAVLRVISMWSISEGARAGRPVEGELIRDIIAAFGPGVEVGGGVRDCAAIESYLALGADRVVLGTAAIRNPTLVREAATAHPGRIVLALDAKNGLVATDGWLAVSTRTAVEVIRELSVSPSPRSSTPTSRATACALAPTSRRPLAWPRRADYR